MYLGSGASATPCSLLLSPLQRAATPLVVLDSTSLIPRVGKSARPEISGSLLVALQRLMAPTRFRALSRQRHRAKSANSSSKHSYKTRNRSEHYKTYLRYPAKFNKGGYIAKPIKGCFGLLGDSQMPQNASCWLGGNPPLLLRNSHTVEWGSGTGPTIRRVL